MSEAKFPEFGDILAGLARIADALPGDDNDARRVLRDLGADFAGPTPSFAAARVSVGSAMLPRLYTGAVIDEPETWLLCACALLIGHEQMRLAGGVETAVTGTRLS